MDEKIMWVETLWNPLNDMKTALMEEKEEEIKVAAYCRISPGRETDIHSLINQINYFTLLIRSKSNWKFAGIYFDKGVSAINIRNRNGFKRLLRHAKEGRIDYIITKNISRFSRNSKELLEIVNELKDINVGIYFEKENVDTLKGYNDFLISTYGALAQQEIENISAATKWGFEKKFAKGIPFFGRLLGYKVTYHSGIPEVNIIEQEAEIVREMFNNYLSGLTLTEIAREMMRREIKTSYGGELWNTVRVKNILTNLTYTGNKLTNEQTKDLLTKSPDILKKQYMIEQSHPAIIDIETFNLVQKRLEEVNPKKSKKYKTKTIRPLSRRMTCGICGRKYLGHPKNGGCSWECRTRIASKELCDGKTLNEKVIRNMFLKAFEKRFDLGEENITDKLLKIVKTVNRNDHYEFHRLKYLTDIELAIEKQLPDIEKMEEDYKLFEEKIIKIEDDRKYRDIVIEWMEDIKSIDEFIETVTIEHMRAWVMEIIVYSKEDYIINWVDDTKTEIGDCGKYEKHNTKPGNALQVDVLKTNRVEPPIQEDIDKGEHDLKATAEVIKIDPGNHLVMMKDIKKNLNQFKVKYEYMADKPKIRTASYCRVSTDHDDQKISLKTQVAYYTYLILKNPRYEFSGIYADDGITATSAKNRREFLRLIDDCKAGKIDLILTKSISRFARNTLDCLKYIKELKEYGTDVYFEKEHIHTADKKSSFMISIMGSLAQEESVNMGAAIRWGKNRQAQRGIVNPGTINYGYRYGKNNEWVIVEEETEIIKRIYREFLKGKTFLQITRELTKDQNTKSPSGKDTWSETTVKNILTNEVYRGNFLYQKCYTKQTIDNLVVPNRGELPMYLIENHHEAIISSDDWEKVQEIHAERLRALQDSIKNRYPKENNKNEAFSKKLYCGECGGIISYKRNRSPRNREEIDCWRCYVARRSSDVDKCNTGFKRQEFIELSFMNMLLDIKHNPKFNEYLDSVISDLDLTPEEIDIEKAIGGKMRSLNQLLYEVVDEELNKKGQDSKKVDELTEEIVNLRNQLKVFKDRKEQVNTIKTDLAWLKKQIKDLVGPKNKYQAIPFNEEIFTKIIKSGVIYDDGRIVFTFNCGIEWFVSLEYKKYLSSKRADERKASKEEFLKSKEVIDLLKFCKEPRTIVEMMEFLNRYKSKAGIINSVINPLMEKGKLERKIDENCKVRQYLYYSVK